MREQLHVRELPEPVSERLYWWGDPINPRLCLTDQIAVNRPNPLRFQLRSPYRRLRPLWRDVNNRERLT